MKGPNKPIKPKPNSLIYTIDKSNYTSCNKSFGRFDTIAIQGTKVETG